MDRAAEESATRALRTLAGYADGRPADAAFDKYVHEDEHLGASLLKALSSATLGARGPRSVAHALNMLGRDAVMERLLSVTARLLADASGDPELALIALRRARLIERLGAGRVTGAVVVHIEAFDWNCPKFITPRYTQEAVDAAIRPLQDRIAELEAQLNK